MIHHILLFMRMMTPNMLMEMCWPQVCAQIKKLYDILLGNARIVFLCCFFRVEHVTSSHAKGRKDQGHAQWWTKSKSARSKKIIIRVQTNYHDI